MGGLNKFLGLISKTSESKDCLTFLLLILALLSAGDFPSQDNKLTIYIFIYLNS
jgi:hypothetical protein